MDTAHRTSDQQSLLLTQAAVRALVRKPALIDSVVDTLDHWDAVAPPAYKALRDEWREINAGREWQRALDPGERGQQLRQASPLGKAIDPQQRLAIIRLCKGRNSNT